MRKVHPVLCWRLAIPFLVLWGGATPWSTAAAALPGLPAPTYILTDLGAPNGYSRSGGAALNGWGHAAADALPSDPVNVPGKAFLFRCGHRIDVGPRLDPTNPADCSSTAINGADEVLGNVTPRDGSPGKVFLYRRGKVLTFSKSGLYAGAFGLNALGQVVGYFVPGPNFDSSRAFLRQPDGKLLDLGTFGGTSASANAINASGQIAGEVDDAQGGYRAFVTEGGGRAARVLKGLGVNSVAYALNDRGEVVGEALYDDLTAQAFLYTGGKMENLGALSDTDAAFGQGINASGHVVGTSAQGGPPFNRRAWVYLGGPLHDLNDCLEPGMAKRWTVTEAHGINDVGQIVGTATNAAGQSRAVLFTPLR